MHIKCPHCLNPVELVESTAETASVTCPSCGSNFALLPETSPPVPSEFGSVGQFQLVERVGRGHFGEVWKAFDETLKRHVALKLPRLQHGTREADREYQEMFLREARSAARLRHPNIVPVHEIARSERGIIIVSDFIDGVNLAELILHRRPEMRRSVEIMKAVAIAIHHAHERGVIHRDLKPGNILLDNAGVPYITDFGLAKREAGEITVTVDGQILGTPAYMSPEQARGKGHYADARSDVYSLGTILFELLTGERPFTGDQAMLVFQILNEEPRRPRSLNPSIPKDLETICLRALEKDPDRRYATALEFAEELDRYLRGEPIRSRPITRAERGWRWVKRHRVISMLSSAAASLLVALVGVSFVAAFKKPEVKEVAGETKYEVVPEPPVEVLLTTKSGEGQITLVPMSNYDHTYQLDKIIPAQPVPLKTKLPPGWYLVVAEHPDGRFHEVYRRVPLPHEVPSSEKAHLYFERLSDGEVRVKDVAFVSSNLIEMEEFPGEEEFGVGKGVKVMSPRHYVQLPAFRLATTELTVGQYRDHMELTGQPLPQQKDARDFPLTFVDWDRAADLAEQLGLRLPEEAEYEYAATNGGATDFPWGDAAPNDVEGWWKVQAVGAFVLDRCRDRKRIVGLFSNVGEWTATPGIFYPHPTQIGSDTPELQLRHGSQAAFQRVIRGILPGELHKQPNLKEDIALAARVRAIRDKSYLNARVGIRFAKSVRPRTTPDAFIRRIGGQ